MRDEASAFGRANGGGEVGQALRARVTGEPTPVSQPRAPAAGEAEGRRIEAALVRAAARGDRLSFHALYERAAPAVYRLAYGVLGRRDAAEEVVQEAFCQAWAALHAFRGQARFRTWLLCIARNAALDLRRRERTRREADRARIAACQRREPSPEAPLRVEELRAALERALAELPENTSTAFRLAVLEGLSYDEVSRVIGTSLDGVKCRVYRAREHLRRRLEGFRMGER